MRNIVLFDAPDVRGNLLPITFTRPVADIRVGILTIREKWERMLPGAYSYMTQDYLREKYPLSAVGDDVLFVAGHVLPDAALVDAVRALSVGEALDAAGKLVAYRGAVATFEAATFPNVRPYAGDIRAVRMLYDIFMMNGAALRSDFAMLTAGRTSLPVSDTCTVVGSPVLPDGSPAVFIEEGAVVEAAVLNVKNGPIYIGRDAEVMEGACLRGPVALCDHSVINMGTKVYGDTTIGPWCKVGGELNNVVMIGYSNKAHDGFLGNAVIGEWCNLGAGAVASNLKNDYSQIKLWNYPAHRFLRTGLQFCGLIMGDHSKAGINTMFNTATVVGVGCNIHGAGFPRNFIASFSEGGNAGFNDVQLSKFFDIASRVMARRHVELTDIDRHIFESIYDIAETYK
ncbi:MAG: GlmU family protein [Pseudoflavonifractor sp.]|nr:GlmU family protein [Pseudoflavonifractor sp.]